MLFVAQGHDVILSSQLFANEGPGRAARTTEPALRERQRPKGAFGSLPYSPSARHTPRHKNPRGRSRPKRPTSAIPPILQSSPTAEIKVNQNPPPNPTPFPKQNRVGRTPLSVAVEAALKGRLQPCRGIGYPIRFVSGHDFKSLP